MLKIGLTGGIGSGKSTVCTLFEKKGIAVIDADIIAHQLVEPDQPALRQISDSFGSQILHPNGSLNRNKLRELIHNNPGDKNRLESILHPLIKSEMQQQIGVLNQPYCILAIPLLLESGWTNMVNRILVIDCTAQQQIKRIKKRDKLSQEQAERILANQIDRQKRLAAADDIIDNSDGQDVLQEQVQKLHDLYLKLSSAGTIG